MGHEHSRIPDEKYYQLNPVGVTIDSFDVDGPILDIGGGGEGIIGLMKGNRVIAIDNNKAELEEAPDGPIKLVMDCRHTEFLRNSFEVVTSFFTMMYIDPYQHERVFREINRVLKPGGKFYLWDITQPTKESDLKTHFAFHLTVKIPTRTIETGYGAPLKRQKIDIVHYRDLLGLTGFHVQKYIANKNGVIHIVADK